MTFQNKKEAFEAMKTALATLARLNLPLPKLAQDLVNKCTKIVAANTKKITPDLGDKDPQGAGIDALINASTLPDKVKTALLEKFKGGEDKYLVEMGNFLSKLEKFYSDHKDDKTYFEAQKITIEKLLIDLIKKDGAKLVLPIIPPAKNINPVNDLTNGSEIKTTKVLKEVELKDRVVKGVTLQSRFRIAANFTFAFDKNMFLQHKIKFENAIMPDIIFNFFKFSNTASWNQAVQQLSSSLGSIELKFEWIFCEYAKAAVLVTGPKLSTMLEKRGEKPEELTTRLEVASAEGQLIFNTKPFLLHIAENATGTKMDLDRVFDSSKCEFSGTLTLSMAARPHLSGIKKADKKIINEISEKVEFNNQQANKMSKIVNKGYRTNAEQKMTADISKEMYENVKEMGLLKNKIIDQQQKEIAEKLIKEGGEKVISIIGRKILYKLIPGLNVISTVMDVIEIFSMISNYFAVGYSNSPQLNDDFTNPIDAIDDNIPPHLKR